MRLLNALRPYLKSVHLANLLDNNQDQRCFPQEGRLPVWWLLSWLEDSGYGGPVELEVISQAIETMTEVDLVTRLSRGVALSSRCLAVGELAVHNFWNGSRQMGGGAGMVARQLSALGTKPILLGICGDDEAGKWLNSQTADFEGEVYCQPDTITSCVSISSGTELKVDISPGTVQVRELASKLEDLLDVPTLVYIPCFPGYEVLLEIAAKKVHWRLICDLGFLDWCGNETLLTHQIERLPSGVYCTLVNAKGLSHVKKNQLGRLCMVRGFEYTVLSDAEKPLWFFSQGGQRRVFPVKPADILIDSCGAGDCLTAGILFALTKGKRMAEAVIFGMELARKKVQTVGVWIKE